MTFVIGVEKLDKSVMNVYFRNVYELTKIHVCVVKYNDTEKKWIPIGAWRMLNILSNMVGMTEQELLNNLKKKTAITFKNSVEIL